MREILEYLVNNPTEWEDENTLIVRSKDESETICTIKQKGLQESVRKELKVALRFYLKNVKG